MSAPTTTEGAVWGCLSGDGLLSAVAGGYPAARTVIDVLGTASHSQEISA